jgi:hypothetical protein
MVPAVTHPPPDRPPDAAAATDADAVAFRSTSNSSAMIVSIPARARMRPAHQLARAQHQLAGRDVGAPDPLLNSAAVERRLRRAVQRGKITGTGHIWGRSGGYRGTPKPVKSSRQLCFSHIACFTELVSSLIAISFLPSTSLQKLCVCVNCLIFGRRKICEPYTRRRGDAKRIKQRFFGMRAMPSKPDRTPTSVQAAAAVSLVALVACALASDAHASRLPVEPGVADGELSARVGTIIERVRAGEPTLLPQLPPEPKMAWRN